MDIVAHGLWGGAFFGQRSRHAWRWAFLLGLCPDLFSFGPFFATHLPMVVSRWRHHLHGPPPAHLIPPYVYHAYDMTHSFVSWGILMGITFWLYGTEGGWAMSAWGLHILFDIPTHSLQFFPTPYAWPFRTPYFDGWPWGNRTFMLANYSAILAAYLLFAASRRMRRAPRTTP